MQRASVFACAAILCACTSLEAVCFSDVSGPSAGRSPVRSGDVLIAARIESPGLRLDVRSVGGDVITGVDRRNGRELLFDASTDARLHRWRVSQVKTLLLVGGLAIGVHAFAPAKAAAMLIPTP
jgi:hypothetical protein